MLTLIIIPGHGFSENWLPDLLLDVKRLRRDNRISSENERIDTPVTHTTARFFSQTPRQELFRDQLFGEGEARFSLGFLENV